MNLELSLYLAYTQLLNVGHRIRDSVLYGLAGKPPLYFYITKAVIQFVESWSKSDRLVAKLAGCTLQLDYLQGPNQLIVIAIKLTAEICADRG